MIYYIYALRNTIDNELYIGSKKHFDRVNSIQAILNIRLSGHICDGKGRKKDIKVYKHLNQIGWENVWIELVHIIDTSLWDHDLNEKEIIHNIHRIEGFYIRQRNAKLNSVIAGRTDSERWMEKVICPNCNIQLNRSSLLRHNKRSHL